MENIELLEEILRVNKSLNYLVEQNAKLNSELNVYKQEDSELRMYKYYAEEFIEDVRSLCGRHFELNEGIDEFKEILDIISFDFNKNAKENSVLRKDSLVLENKRLLERINRMQIEHGEQLKKRDEEIQLKSEQLSAQYGKNLSRIKEEYQSDNWIDEYQSPYK
mgnify:CR=1 FL=1